MSDAWMPVSHENCRDVRGPFYHGTRVELMVGDFITTGYPSHFEAGRILKHVYFSASLEPAIWGAQLAVALSGSHGRGHIYLVEPTGLFEDDPNLTNKRFPGNPSRSYRTSAPLRILGVAEEWQPHPPAMIEAMLKSLADLRSQGLAMIED